MRQIGPFALGLVLILTYPAQGATWGDFQGKVLTEWLDDGRKMRLLEDFTYVDPRGEKWLAPKGAVVDGASIPRPFWSYIGGPFEGKYRSASVVHDVACQEKTRAWRNVHQMFYVAALRGGVAEVSAKIMYGAVFHFGPRWKVDLARILRDDADFLRMREFIRQNSSISLEAIEKLTREFLMKAIPEVPPLVRIPPE